MSRLEPQPLRSQAVATLALTKEGPQEWRGRVVTRTPQGFQVETPGLPPVRLYSYRSAVAFLVKLCG